MKVLIVSDSHGWSEILAELKERYEETVDAMFHCGDSELAAADPETQGYLIVRGNCDTEDQFPYDLIEGVGGKRIFVTHGHRYQVKMSLMNLKYKAQEYGADFVFFGHTHLVGAEQVGDMIFVNPGSITLPRGRREKTYALLEANKSGTTVRFYDETHQELADLRQVFQ
ncbi:metallophosphoesterase [Bacillus xiapuensis]|uniref:metallophosphoesterase n=1 Tax=Bacillus xiapuensis TaxID=2014075 RepID=UPI000C24ED95|nr:metallophosphoesterase [Bacillus xiapuensis]